MSRFVVALSGPGGAGKSTIAAKLSEQIRNCVNIDVDQIKHFIVNGFIYDDSPEGVDQWRLLGKNINAVVENFAAKNYAIIINGYLSNEAWDVVESATKIDVKILLLPEKAEIVRRDLKRKHDVQLGAKVLSIHHEHFSKDPYFQDYIKVDSTHQTSQETAQAVLDIIRNETGE